MTEAAGKPERDILHDKRPHHDLIERILLEQHYAGRTLATRSKLRTRLRQNWPRLTPRAGLGRREWNIVTMVAVDSANHILAAHTKIEQGCKNWRPVASGAGSPEETKPDFEHKYRKLLWLSHGHTACT